MINKLIIGYTTKEHLLLDLDETSLFDVVALSKMLIHDFYEVGDILILSSSTPSKKNYTKFDSKGIPQWRHTYRNYHIVTDNVIGFKRCLEIIDILVDLDILQPEYRQIRQFRGDMTLRVSNKPLVHRNVEPPKIEVFIHNPYKNYRDNMIRKYLDFVNAVKNADITLELYKRSEKAVNLKQHDNRIMEKLAAWKKRLFN